MDVDPNYDPSDFLMQGLPSRENKPQTSGKIHDDLAVSESDEDIKNDDNIKLEDNDIDAGVLWF